MNSMQFDEQPENNENKYDDLIIDMNDINGYNIPNPNDINYGKKDLHDLPTYAAIQNKWRPICKQHFEDFWKAHLDFFDDDEDDDMSDLYYNKFIQLKIDDIRCLPYLNEKHLSMNIHMLSNDAKETNNILNTLRYEKYQFFEFISKTAQCDAYLKYFEEAGIITWELFANRILTEKDLQYIMPDNQLNNNIDRKLLFSNVPKNVWNYFGVPKHDTLREREKITPIPDAQNFEAQYSLTSHNLNKSDDEMWNNHKRIPNIYIEYLFIFYLFLLFSIDLIIAVWIYTKYITFDTNDMINKGVLYLIDNILIPVHIIIQLLLVLSWTEWLLFVDINTSIRCICMKRIALITLFILSLGVLFNGIFYFLPFMLNNSDIYFIKLIHNIQHSKFYRNTWLIFNVFMFLYILLFVIKRSLKTLFQSKLNKLALTNKGEQQLVDTFLDDDIDRKCCKCYLWISTYLSLTVTKYVLYLMFINILLVTESVIWLYWRYIQIPNETHANIRKHKNEFKLIIMISDIFVILFGVLIVLTLKKQRNNFESIKELDDKSRKWNHRDHLHSSQDLHGLDGFTNNFGSPML